MSDIYGTFASAAMNIGQSFLNSYLSRQQTMEDRRQNYLYNEAAANNADLRTRALYNDFYSPEALLRQYKEAGLSPSIMFGGTPGQGGMAGAQGAGSSGQQSIYYPINLLEAAQVELTNEQTKKTKAETQNIQADTELKDLQAQFDEYRNMSQEAESILTLSLVTDRETGERRSLYEIAQECGSYKEFVDKVREVEGTDKFNQAISTEKGQEVLRRIYTNQYKFERDIDVLSHEEVNASFQKSIIDALSKKGFQDQNASTAVEQLKAAAETAKLTEEQKKAWNDLIKKLPEGTTKDIVIVMGMILGQYAGKVNINTGN